MLILCPSCNANYEVPETRMRPGRRVRCAACGAEWTPAAEQPAEEPSFDEEPPRDPDPIIAPVIAPLAPVVSESDRLSAAPPPAANGSLALRAAWAISIAFLLFIAAAAYGWRAEVMQIWPASVRLYDRLGLMETTGLASR